MTDTNWDAVSHVLASTYRTQTLTALADAPQTPSELVDATGLDFPYVSRSLSKLRDAGLAELLVSEDTKKGRIYAVTDEGADVSDVLDERGVEA